MFQGVGLMGRLWAAFAALLLALPWSVVQAQNAEPAPMLDWRCSLETSAAKYNIYCVEAGFDDTLPDDNAVAGLNQDAPGAVAGKDVASFMRNSPAALGGRIWMIPLYNLAFDMDRVRLLARSVMCGRDPRCAVQLDTVMRGELPGFYFVLP